MASVRVVFYFVVVVVLSAGWAFFYLQSGAGDLAAVDAARSAANALRALDSRWSDQIVAARVTRSIFEPATHGRTYAELEVRALRVTYPGIGLALVGVRNAFEEKANAMRRIARGDGHFEEAWFAPTGPRLDLLSRVLDRAFDDALLWSELYRAWLLYYTAFLVTLMLYALHRIRAARVPGGH